MKRMSEPTKGSRRTSCVTILVRVTIPRGASARQIGDLLARQGVVADGRLFSLRAALAGKRGDFNSGGFTLRKDMSYAGWIVIEQDRLPEPSEPVGVIEREQAANRKFLRAHGF